MDQLDLLARDIKKIAGSMSWPAPDVWEQTHAAEAQLMREWALAAVVVHSAGGRLEVFGCLGVESGVPSPMGMSREYTIFLLGVKIPREQEDDPMRYAIRIYAEGRKRVKFNN